MPHVVNNCCKLWMYFKKKRD